MTDRASDPVPSHAATDGLLARIAEAGDVPFRADGDGLALSGLRAGREALLTRIPPGEAPPPWWDGKHRGLALARAQLDGADLVEADLSGANLSGASLVGALARSARFEGAILEEANFSEADCSGANFTGIVGGEAHFPDAMLEDADFTGATMRFARMQRALLDGASFARADLWGADFTGADADYSRFEGGRLDEANLSDMNLTFANFDGASLKKARLNGSRLRGASLSGVALDGADLSGADLSDTNLVRLNLMSCRLRHARFSGALLTGVRFRADQLGGAVGEEIAGEYEAAQASYLAIEHNMKSIGSHDEASWAYKRGRRMGRLHAGAEARAAWARRTRAPRTWKPVLQSGYRWVADRFVEWLCDYGESLSRIARAFVILIGVFGALFGIAGGLIPEGGNGAATYNPLDLLSYSALNMMTANPPEIGVKPVGRFTNLLVGIEGAAGIILMGLFGFVLGNRLRR
ncbi:pentapeptide repeat-containing protein [Methylobacterium marchantiae]|uniref:Pentapeptide repeat-containing protein n=1 Tax=Methylobacterium marchantiae TaxID=600331 RepID=A0ABW3X3I6_9HYPH|nr:hypothetical protein AIGOOFII_1667 [Methylobacterium marchantiae]